LNLSYSIAFTKHLINSSFMSRGGGSIFMGLTRGWTLYFPGSYVFPGSQSRLKKCLPVERLSQRNKKLQNFLKPPCTPNKYQSPSDLHRCSFGQHYSELPLVVFSCYHKFPLIYRVGNRNGISGIPLWRRTALRLRCEESMKSRQSDGLFSCFSPLKMQLMS